MCPVAAAVVAAASADAAFWPVAEPDAAAVVPRRPVLRAASRAARPSARAPVVAAAVAARPRAGVAERRKSGRTARAPAWTSDQGSPAARLKTRPTGMIWPLR